MAGRCPGRSPQPDSRAGRQPRLSSASARSRHTWPAGSSAPGHLPSLKGLPAASSGVPGGWRLVLGGGAGRSQTQAGRGAAGSPAPPLPCAACSAASLALGSRSRPGDCHRARPPAPVRTRRWRREGALRARIPPRPEAPGRSARLRPQPQLPAGDGARPLERAGLEEPRQHLFHERRGAVRSSNTDLLAEFLALGAAPGEPGRAEVTEQLAALVRALTR